MTNSIAKKRIPLASNEANLREAALNSRSLRELLTHLGYSYSGFNVEKVKYWAEFYSIELPVWSPKDRANRLSDEKLFCANSKAHRGSVKQRLRDLGHEFVCRDCGVDEEWNGKPLSLQLEHTNGISNDNRIENLALLCPNCHSQTETFAGRNKKYKKI